MKQSLIFLLIASLFSSCITKAPPAEYAGFAPIEKLRDSIETPFHKAWVDPHFDWNNHRFIYIAPVSTDYIKETEFWQTLERGVMYEKDLEVLSDYTQAALESAFLKDSLYRFDVVFEPYPEALTLEFALTEVVPNKATLEGLSYAGGPFIKGTSILFNSLFQFGGQALRGLSVSKVAFEARIVDNNTGKIVAAFADREYEKASLVNLKGLTWYGHAKSIIKEWSKQIVKVLNKRDWEVVHDSPSFELKIW